MHRPFAVSFLFFLALPPVRAEEPLDLAALLAEADHANPGVLALDERAAAAAEVAIQEQAPPDPRLSVSYTNDGLSSFTLGESPFSNVTVRWDQDLPRPSGRKLAGEVARREHGVALAAGQTARARLRARVVADYAAIWRADRIRDLLGESRAALVTAQYAARARLEA